MVLDGRLGWVDPRSHPAGPESRRRRRAARVLGLWCRRPAALGRRSLSSGEPALGGDGGSYPCYALRMKRQLSGFKCGPWVYLDTQVCWYLFARQLCQRCVDAWSGKLVKVPCQVLDKVPTNLLVAATRRLSDTLGSLRLISGQRRLVCLVQPCHFMYLGSFIS